MNKKKTYALRKKLKGSAAHDFVTENDLESRTWSFTTLARDAFSFAPWNVQKFVEMGPIWINDQHGSTFRFFNSSAQGTFSALVSRFRMLQLARQLGTNWTGVFRFFPVISAQSYKMLQIIIVLPSRLNALTNIDKLSNVLVSDSETFTQSAIVGTVDIGCWFSTNDRYTPQDKRRRNSKWVALDRPT